VKNDLCYWLRNKPLIKAVFFFYKIQWTSKFTDNQGITVTDICILVRIFVSVCIHSFRRCLSKLYTDNIFVKATSKCFQKKKEQHRYGLVLGLAYSMPHCWLEVSLHPEGPATGQLDQGFPWFSLVPEQMLSWNPNSKLHCMLHMQPSQL
jgi:hypothetical protein